MKKVKVLTIILTIIAIIMIAVGGLYLKQGLKFENIIKEYKYSKDINGVRSVILGVNKGNKTIIKDKDGKVVETEENLTDEQLKEKGYNKEVVSINSQESLNKENYKTSKAIIEKRLEKMSIGDYVIKLDDVTGDIWVDIPENKMTDSIVGNLSSNGKFEISDSETKEVLMNNNDIHKVSVMYGQNQITQVGDTPGTTVYLNIEFTKEGANKIKDISNNYKKVEEKKEENKEESKEENKEEKQITLKIDDEEIMTQAFAEPIETGNIQLSVGRPATDSEVINENIKRATNVAISLDNGKLPIKYEVVNQEYISSDIEKTQLRNVTIVFIVFIIMIALLFIVKYRTNGFIGAISYIGMGALLSLILKYANVIISIEGMFAVGIIFALDFIFVNKLLSKYKESDSTKEDTRYNVEETYKNFLIKIVPIIIIAIALSFAKWIPISSFGMVMLWGIILIAIYNIVVTNTLLKTKAEK